MCVCVCELARDKGLGLESKRSLRINICAAEWTEQLDTATVALSVTWDIYTNLYIVLAAL